MKLQDGDRIAVIGAGPAGTFFALTAWDIATRKGMKISVAIFDGKDFVQPGPPGCNLCAGVISETLSEKLHKMGIRLPSDRVQMEVEDYLLSTRHYDICLHRRRRSFPIYTVFRGNGPRDRSSRENISFDDYLLNLCQSKGIRVIREMVTEMTIPPDSATPIALRYGSDSDRFDADLVVVACGLNTRFLSKLSQLDFGYKPPSQVYTCQAEIPIPGDYIQSKIGRKITTLALDISKVRFAAFTPKKEHLTVTVIGKSDVGLTELKAVLDHPQVRDEFLKGISTPKNFCFCRPKIAVSAARNVFTDRLVVIGDAAFSRYYKNGIESAFDTAGAAALCALEHGIGREDFGKHYLNREIRTIKVSSFYGRILFRFFDVAFKSHLLSATLISLLSHRPKSSTAQRMSAVLWSLFTGNKAYQKIVVQLCHPRLQARLTLEMILVILRKLLYRRGALRDGKALLCEVDSLGPLGEGETVVIIGGGPGGVGCALALKKFAQEKGIGLHIVIYEGKDFETHPHYNQCVGVLSPPIVDIIEKELGIPFPHHLKQRKITGYVLHSKHQSLLLSGENEASLSVRRVTFDRYMLNQAIEHGIEVVQSRVTDLEIGEEGVMVYSETDNRRADVVVGAFGLDDGTARIFERISRYRQPRYLNSIVSKIHPGEDIVTNFENNIHAFLPPVRGIEFGAITPKKNHLTINVAGARVTADSLRDFLNFNEVLEVLPPRTTWDPEALSFFKGRFPIRVARGFYGDRFVIIGDAAGLLRPFKGKGVNTALLTGMRAANTMLNVGISKAAFGNFLAKCRDITDDLPYGKVMRWLALKIAHWRILDPIMIVARDNYKLERALFNSVSAHETFKVIFHQILDLKLFLLVFRSAVLHRIKRTSQPNAP